MKNLKQKQNNIPFLIKTSKSLLAMSMILLMIFTSCSKDDDGPIDPVLTPSLTSISPISGPKTTIVTINGNDFGTDSNTTQVFFNEVEATVQSVGNNEIIAVVPPRAFTGVVKIMSNGITLTGPEFTYTISDIQVSTFAGSTNGFADGVGTASQFAKPVGVAVDAQGNVYVADSDNHKIRKIAPNGVVTTLAGSTNGFADGTGTAAQFAVPAGVAVDAQGNVYVADLLNNKIRKITPSGVVTTLAGSTGGYADGTGSAAQFANPAGVAVDAENNVYVADLNNSKIRKITPSGVVTTLAGSTSGFANGTGTSAKFKGLFGIAVDNQGNVYVADSDNHKIRKITPSGVVSTLAGSTLGFLDGTGSNAKFQRPSKLAVDTYGNVFVGDFQNHRIRKITPSGVVSTLAGSTSGFADGTGANAKFWRPMGVAVDIVNSVYVAGRGNHKIRKITQE